MKKIFNIAIIGPGLMAQKHYKTIQEMNNINVVGIVYNGDPKNNFFYKNTNINFYKNIYELVESSVNVDGIIICTPNDEHYSYAIECINQKIPILIEKPITNNIDQALHIHNLSNERNVPVLIGHHRRHNNIIIEAKKIISSNVLGNIISFNGLFVLSKSIDYFNVEWRTQANSGPLMINFIHDIDLLKFFFGDVVEVFAMKGKSHRHYNCEETVSINLKFNSGIVGNFLVSDISPSPFSWEFTSGENISYPFLSGFSYSIFGDRASLTIPDLNLYYYEGENDWMKNLSNKKLNIVRNNPLKDQLLHFMNIISGTENIKCTASDSLSSLLTIKAIRQSIEKNIPIYLADC